jgi:hypothetical protein
MSGRCVGQPVSWLRLERYHLRELASAEREAVDAHLASCAACRAFLAYIDADDERALPSLAKDGVPSAKSARVVGTRRRFASADLRLSLAAAALVAAIVIGVRHPWRTDDASNSLARSSVKGGGVGFSLVREDDERLIERGVYREGDRLKALVSCSPNMHPSLDLVVLEPEGASFPLEPVRRLVCGNDVPLPGAFRLTGNSEKKVCIAWSEGDPIERNMLAQGASGDHVLCIPVTPAPSDGR